LGVVLRALRGVLVRLKGIHGLGATCGIEYAPRLSVRTPGKERKETYRKKRKKEYIQYIT
jgi:hypothetical protein